MKKFTLSCILTGILLTAFLVLSSTSSSCSSVNSMSEDTLDDDTEETDSIDFYPFFGVDFGIFVSSPRGSALLAAAEEDSTAGIPGLDAPIGEESLDEIRFGGWTEEDYWDNDYLRAFRRYMDAWLQGKKMADTEADPSTLEPYRDRLRGKFLVFNVRAFSFGGLLYLLVPIDDPYLLLHVWIYSTIDDGHINEYQVQYVLVSLYFEEMYREEGVPEDTFRQWLLEYVASPNLW